MRCGLILISLIFTSLAHADAALLEVISERLSRSPVVRAHVTQEKTLAILTRPMRSEGQLLFGRDHGLYWAISTPIAAETIITHDALIQITDNHRRIMTVAEQPALAAIGVIFFPVLSGDIASLQNAFAIQVSGDQQQWSLALTPRNEPLNRFIATITLTGSNDLERIELHDHKGDITAMQFSDVQREQAHFDF